jgi:hypothetical protein
MLTNKTIVKAASKVAKGLKQLDEIRQKLLKVCAHDDETPVKEGIGP